MHAERDHLVRFVFPRLREDLLRRRLHLVDVDLRWGVTADQDAFDLCMDEINRCQPRFICILGGRYGWTPPPKTVPADFMERVLAVNSPAGPLTSEEQAVLDGSYIRDDSADQYRLREKPRAAGQLGLWNEQTAKAVPILQRAGLHAAQYSITASEIQYGALQRLDQPAFRYFYFRNPEVTSSIPEPSAGAYREKEGSAEANLLAALKQSITSSFGQVPVASHQAEEQRLAVYEYQCEWDDRLARITKLEAFGARVYSELLSSIDAEFGTAPPAKMDEFEEENAAVEAFIESRVERYVVGSRKDVFDRLHAHTEGTSGNGYLCVVGEPGSGKSALLGRFYRDYVEGAGDHPAHPNDLVIPHFVGASAASTNVRLTLRRLCHELSAGVGTAGEIPDNYDKLREALPLFLKRASEAGRVIILIDAINQLDPVYEANTMRWLPVELPDNVRIVLTALPGPALDALRSSHGPPVEIALGPLDSTDATAIMDAFLSRYRKTMDSAQRAELLGKADAGTPLYLLTALEELRTLGTYEEITGRIRELPGEARSLFVWILKHRLSNDPDFRDRHGHPSGAALVEKFVSSLGVSRHGLSPQELTGLIDPGDPLGNVAALQRLLRPYLMWRGELLDFYHGQLREAVEGEYLSDAEERIAAHGALAGYFRHAGDPSGEGKWDGRSSRCLSELPYHQIHAEAWPELETTLCNIFFLEAKTRGGMVFELALDFDSAVEAMPSDRPMQRLLSLLGDALRREIHFVSRHAGALFQCLWNLCWWYDAPVTAGRDDQRNGGRKSDRAPQGSSAPRVSTLLETWHGARKNRRLDVPWLRSLQPPPLQIGGSLRASFAGHTDTVSSVAYSPDFTRIVSGSHDGSLRVWNAETGEQIRRISLGEAGEMSFVAGVKFSPDGRRLIAAQTTLTMYTLTSQRRSSVQVWDAQNGAQLLGLETSGVGITCVALSPDGGRILYGYADGTVRVWSANDRGEELSLRAHQEDVSGVDYSSDGRLFLTASGDGTVRIWDSASGQMLRELSGHETSVRSAAFCPMGRQVIGGARDGSIRLWDAETGQELLCLRGDEKSVSCVAWVSDGQRVVSGSDDGAIRLWDIPSASEAFCLRESSSAVECIACSPKARRIVTGHSDGKVAVWDRDHASVAGSIRPSRGDIKDLEAAADGDLLITRYKDRSLDVYSMPDAQHLVFLAESLHVATVTISHDGKWLATNGYDRTVRIWDTLEAREWRCFSDQQLPDALAFSPDSRLLLSIDHDYVDMGPWSGNSNYTVKVWSVESGEQLARFRIPDDRSEPQGEFSADGSRVTVRFHNGEAMSWDVGADQEVRERSRDTHNTLDALAAPIVQPEGKWQFRRVQGRPANDLPMNVVMRNLQYYSQESVASIFADLGMEVVLADTDETVAWFPVGLDNVVALRGGRTWAGSAENDVYILRLEEV